MEIEEQEMSSHLVLLNIANHLKKIPDFLTDHYLGATLHFDVELLSMNEAPPPSNVFKQIDIDDDHQLSKEEVCCLSSSFFAYYLLFYFVCYIFYTFLLAWKGGGLY